MGNIVYSFPYIGIFFVLFLLYQYKWKIGTIRINAVFTVLVVLSIFLGLRGHVITDFVNYYSFYKTLDPSCVSDEIFSGAFEPGFILYTSLCKKIIDNYFIWIFFSALIDVLLLYVIFKRYSSNVILSFIVFISFMGILLEFNLLRNSKAIMFFLLSLKYVETKNFIKYSFLNILGMLFHFSAILYFPLYFILNRRINKKLVWIVFGLLTLLSFIGYPMSSNLFGFVGLDSILDYEKWQNYLEISNNYGFSFGFIERAVSFIIFTLTIDKLERIGSYNRVFYNCFIFYYFSFLIFSDNPVLTQRMPMLFIFAYWILYPNVIQVLDLKYRKVFSKYLLLLSFCKLFVGTTDPLYEYENLLFGITDFRTKANFVESTF